MFDSILSLVNINKQFGFLLASDSVTLDLRAAEIPALIGPNGAGKSHLIKQIGGEIQSDSRDIPFNRQHINVLDAVQRSRLGLGRTLPVSGLIAGISRLANVMFVRQFGTGNAVGVYTPVLTDNSLVNREWPSQAG